MQWVELTRMQRAFRGFLWLMAAASLGNAIWMLGHGWSWFGLIPGVTDTGPPNLHLIHDVGVAYAVAGLGLLWCARRGRPSYPVFAGVALFFIGHALGHIVEILAGFLPSSHWWIDIPLVFLPATLLAAAAAPGAWRRLNPGE